MKIKESVHEQDDKIIIKKTHDFGPVMKQMEEIRSKGVIGMDGETSTQGENRFIGRIPLPLMASWCKEAGVSWDDVHARSEVIKKKILSGDFDKFRSDWKGTY